MLTRAAESFRAHGITSSRDFAKHPPAYIIDLYSGPGAQYRVQQFPILAKLLAEHYQPVARTADGVIYRRDGYRALVRHSPKSNR